MVPDWIPPLVATGFAGVLWYLARRIMTKQDEISAAQAEAEKQISGKLDVIHAYMQSELRQFDVRLSVVETLVLPKK